ncbi:MAG: hypothetical protein JXB50_06560, partial [Spirochaetes bacterium]|nr:hypothetical protein [Spirochaetota bacterium]
EKNNDILKYAKITKKSFTFKIISIKEDKNQNKKNHYKLEYDMSELLQKILKNKTDLTFASENDEILFTGDIKKKLNEYYKTVTIKKRSQNFCYIENKYNSIIIIPLYVGNQKIGIIQLKNEIINFYKLSDLKYYRELSQNLGLIISNQQTQSELNERVKELTCLYGIANASEDHDATLDEIMNKTIFLLKSAWQYPKITQVRIVLDGKIYTTANNLKEIDKQKADIIINDKKRGTLEVIYTKKKILLDEGPFLLEERHLINTIAKELSLIIEKKYSEIDKKNLEDQLKLADRLATIGQLSSGVAHELNEPLCNILGFVQLMQKDHTLSKKIKRDLEKILSASLHAREIVRKLLIFARQMPTKKSQININQLIREGIYFLKSRCEKENIDLSLSLDENIPELIIDPSQLNQILINLVVNSIQAMPNGGKLNIKTSLENDNILFIVEDNGIGMDEKTLKQVFIPFFTTKEIGQGTGLGLPVVHGIVSSYGGTINIESKIGTGSKFTIQLPLSELKITEEKSNG